MDFSTVCFDKTVYNQLQGAQKDTSLDRCIYIDNIEMKYTWLESLSVSVASEYTQLHTR